MESIDLVTAKFKSYRDDNDIVGEHVYLLEMPDGSTYVGKTVGNTHEHCEDGNICPLWSDVERSCKLAIDGATKWSCFTKFI